MNKSMRVERGRTEYITSILLYKSSKINKSEKIHSNNAQQQAPENRKSVCGKGAAFGLIRFATLLGIIF